MTELKTLQEIANEVGFPFDAIGYGLKIHFIAKTPREIAIGWQTNCGTSEFHSMDNRLWTLAPAGLENSRRAINESTEKTCNEGNKIGIYRSRDN
jgi:hypothetical protein